MARIVIDARFINSSTGRYVERLLHYLQKIDHENTYLVLLVPEDLDTWEPINQNFKKVASPYKKFTFGEQLGLWRQLKNLNPDLVHFGMTHQPILYKGKVVTTVHDLTTARFRNPSKNALIFGFKQWVYRDLIWLVARKSARIITGSEYVKKDLAAFTGVTKHKIIVTHEAADKITAQPEPLAGVKANSFLLYVGRPLPHKNLRRLAEAFSIARHKNPSLKLVLAGADHPLYRDFQKWLKKEGVDGVELTGFVREGQLRWLYESCAAYVFPSLSEGFGLPGLEAMVHGAPVISSNATCLPEIYGSAAHYFDPQDVKDMVDKINDVVANPLLRTQLINKGKIQAAKYSWAKMAEQTQEIYKEVLGKS